MKEMKNVRPAFEVYEGDVSKLVGYQKIRCHIVWDVKLGENFRRKARLVAGGHTTDTPSSITYSSVVSRESVRIALTIAALNGLDILACDIQNAYLNADCREKIYTIAGDEFGSDAGKVMIVKKALYGLKSSGAAFWAMLTDIYVARRHSVHILVFTIDKLTILSKDNSTRQITNFRCLCRTSVFARYSMLK